jgi:hypothetical protein
VNAVTPVRVVVVLAFCVLTHLIYSVITLPLRPAITPMFESADTWAGALDKGFSLVALAIGLRGAFAICRRLWPANPA